MRSTGNIQMAVSMALVVMLFFLLVSMVNNNANFDNLPVVDNPESGAETRGAVIENDEFGRLWYDNFDDNSGTDVVNSVGVRVWKGGVKLGVTDWWSKKNPTSNPSARIGHAMATVYGEDKVMLFGGWDCALNAVDNETWVYDFCDNQWTNMSPNPHPGGQYGHAMATLYNTDKVVLIKDNGSPFGTETWIYETTTNAWTNKYPASKPSVYWYSAMATIYGDDKVVLFGGNDGNEGWHNSDETWVYDLSENAWTNMHPPQKPSARSEHAMATIYGDDKVVLFGGDGGGLDDETWVYDLSENVWTNMKTATKPSARYHSAMATIYGTDRVVLFGGSTGNGVDDETWIYDLSDDTWTKTQLSQKPYARGHHAMATIYGSNRVALFGGDPGRDETWTYEYGYERSGRLISRTISLPWDMHWGTFSVTKTEPANTFINISVIDADTNITIPEFDNLTSRNINLSALNGQDITSIRLKASFSGNGSSTPSLDSWGVEWTEKNAWRDSFVGDGKCAYPAGMDEHTVGYWKFEEGSGNVARDLSGNGNDGVLTNMDNNDWVEGSFGKALEFDGTGEEYIDCGNDESLDITEITVSAWINAKEWKGSGKWNYIVNKEHDGTTPSWFLDNDQGQLRFQVYVDGNSYSTSSSLPPLNEWHHVAGTYDSETVRLYLDGTEVSSNPVPSGPMQTNDAPLLIGASSHPVCYGERNFNGTIDEVRISTITRTPDEIHRAYQAGIAIRAGQVQLANNEIKPDENTSALWHFNKGEGHILRDSSGNGNDGIIYGANWTDGAMGKALVFDGDDDYVRIPNSPSLSISNAITVEFWVNLHGDSYTMIRKQPSDWMIEFTGNIPEWYITAGGSYKVVAGIAISYYEWHHIIGTYDGNMMRMYIDGNEVNTASKTGKLQQSNLYLEIGNWGEIFHGIIDEVAIYNRTLSSDKIYNHSCLYRSKATIRSETINLPDGYTWSNFHFASARPKNTYLNITGHDAITDEILFTDNGDTNGRNIRLSSINALKHPSIYLQAYLQSNRTKTPVLYDWAVSWKEMAPPEFTSPIDTVFIMEDEPKEGVLDLTEHFYDQYYDIRPSRFSIEYISDLENISLRINNSLLDVVNISDNWTGSVEVKVNCTNLYNLTTPSNIFTISVTETNDAPIWLSKPPIIEMIEDTALVTNWTLYDYIYDI